MHKRKHQLQHTAVDYFQDISPNATSRDPIAQVNNGPHVRLISKNIAMTYFGSTPNSNISHSPYSNAHHGSLSQLQTSFLVMLTACPLCMCLQLPRQCLCRILFLLELRVRCPESMQVTSNFRTSPSFLSYCNTYRRILVLNYACLRGVIVLPLCDGNRSGCYRCSLQLLLHLLQKPKSPSTLLSFPAQSNEAVELYFSCTIGQAHLRKLQNHSFRWWVVHC